MPPTTKTETNWSKTMQKGFKTDPINLFRKFIIKDKPKLLPLFVFKWFIKNCLTEIESLKDNK